MYIYIYILDVSAFCWVTSKFIHSMFYDYLDNITLISNPNWVNPTAATTSSAGHARMVLSICCRSTCFPKIYLLDYLVFLYSSLLGFLCFCFVVLLSCCNVALLCCCLVFLFLYNTLQLSMENVIESGGCHACSPKRQAANGQLYNSSCQWPALQFKLPMASSPTLHGDMRWNSAKCAARSSIKRSLDVSS